MKKFEEFIAEQAGMPGKDFADVMRESRMLRLPPGETEESFAQRSLNAMQYIESVWSGRVSMRAFAETMSTSDFSYLFADTLQRSLMASLPAVPRTWTGIFQERTLNDFRTEKIVDLLGGEAQAGLVPELSPYPVDDFTDTQYTYKVDKYGKQFRVSFEAIVNDDLNALKAIPDKLQRTVVHTENKKTAAFYANSATVYNNTNKNILNTTNGAASNNPVFGVQAIIDFNNVIANQVDADGNPLQLNDGQIILEYGYGAKTAVENFLNSGQVEFTSGSYKFIGSNFYKAGFVPRLNPWLANVDPTHLNAFYFHLVGPRGPFVLGRLRGHENPEVFRMAPNHDKSPDDGDYGVDALGWKIRFFFGLGLLDPKFTYTSNGSGS